MVPDLNTRSGLLPCAFVSPKPGPCPASGLVSVSPAAGVAPYFNLWPVPNGPEITTISGGLTGTATLFSHPLQTIREDFGNMRLDQTLSANDTFAVFTPSTTASASRRIFVILCNRHSAICDHKF